MKRPAGTARRGKPRKRRKPVKTDKKTHDHWMNKQVVVTYDEGTSGDYEGYVSAMTNVEYEVTFPNVPDSIAGTAETVEQHHYKCVRFVNKNHVPWIVL